MTGSGITSFTLTAEPVTPAEQELLAPDLDSLGLGAEVWEVLHAMLGAGSATSRPLLLRALGAEGLRGLAFIIECRRANRALFSGRVADLFDRFSGPQFYWSRVGNLVDASSNAGFVAPGVSRDEFAAEALRDLCRRYLAGTVMEPGPPVAGSGYVAFPLFDHGLLDTRAIGDPDEWLGAHRNMRRKVAKFRNKGGTAEVIRGALDPATAAEVLRCLGSLRTWVTTPFQDIYGTMVTRASALDSSRLIHIVMRLDGAVVGYHSFAESPSGLHALSGAFDRERHSNFHAYENMIIETARYCAEYGKTVVEFGPVLNDTKKAMMSGFVRSHARVYSRMAPYRWSVPFVVGRSNLHPERIAPYARLQR